jgi:hypothetical protein
LSGAIKLCGNVEYADGYAYNQAESVMARIKAARQSAKRRCYMKD